MTLLIQENIFRLKVSVDDILLVKMLNGEAKLSYIKASFILREGHLSGEVKAKIPSRAEI